MAKKLKSGVKTLEDRQKEIERSNLAWANKKTRRPARKINPYWFDNIYFKKSLGA